ncbi:DUF4998 domain-containing protein [Sphingobacterium athyrii]|uniref:DUF5000 domain-containing protein n=1 Tax=Sphingobacterium athyrii TaxID=2152717 RepID=A0A363NX02_9SPHI|nr:DUF4998 domain-containing protein [Sphingobacterium athyrii]PUV25346.1 hypothetical protein DCO56_10510 [Sphingobacterium athyrii]
MKLKYIVECLAFLLCLAVFSSCRKGDEYKKFFGDGELIYASRVNKVIVHPGNRRILLSAILSNDPLVAKIKVLWNQGKDSLVQKIVRAPENDTLDLMIDNLEEGGYNFVFYTYDKENHPSVALNVSGVVYGESYSNSLVNRRVKALKYGPNENILHFSWANPNLDDVGVELLYKHKDGSIRTKMFLPNSTDTTLYDFDANTNFRYRTLFKPDSNAVDLFTVNYTEIIVPGFERELDKSKFNLYLLPTDATTAHGWVMPNMWDEKYDNGFATINQMPQWFTFDIGLSASPSKFKIWQAADRIYEKENMRKFEIWGSGNPAADGSWDNWTKLASCESRKPSGLPGIEKNEVDIAFAKAGEDFVLPADLPRVRYIRIKVLETWGKAGFVTIGELNVYTKDKNK